MAELKLFKTRSYGDRLTDRVFGIHDRTMEIMAGVAMAVLIVHWMLVMWFIVSRLGSLDFLRLHYTAALGVDWIAVWWMVLIFPGFGLLLFFVNAAFAGLLSKQYRLFSPVIMSITVFLEVVVAIGGIMALLLNG
ncbi:MAG: hypothetical protein U9Q03_02530 [Patescibacteria group bacterium]|nr:hypothetical protein [Patescibacteria group bacterium]